MTKVLNETIYEAADVAMKCHIMVTEFYGELVKLTVQKAPNQKETGEVRLTWLKGCYALANLLD